MSNVVITAYAFFEHHDAFAKPNDVAIFNEAYMSLEKALSQLKETIHNEYEEQSDDECVPDHIKKFLDDLTVEKADWFMDRWIVLDDRKTGYFYWIQRFNIVA